MTARNWTTAATSRGPRRVRLDDGILVLPPVTLSDLPPDGVIGTFRGIAALRFTTPAGAVFVFLHDLPGDDVTLILDVQRQQAELQLGQGYARRPFWWEATL